MTIYKNLFKICSFQEFVQMFVQHTICVLEIKDNGVRKLWCFNNTRMLYIEHINL